jgi:hypothetical protein
VTVLRLRSDDLEWREVHGEVVAIDLKGSVYFTLNRTGAELWPSLSEGATRDQLVERLCDAYRVDEATAARDVDAFLDSLRERELLTA